MKTRTGTKQKRRLHISHLDLDGIGAIMLSRITGKKYFECAYHKTMSVNYDFEQDMELWAEILTYDVVHITDISVPEAYYEQLLDNCDEVMLFDHHESSAGLKKFPNVFHDTERSGTKIYFDEYIRKFYSRVPSILSHFVTLVHTYDTWREESPLWDEAVNLNRVMFGMNDWQDRNPMTSYTEFFAFYEVKLAKLKEWRWLRKEQEIIERAVWKEEQAYIKAITDMSIRVDHRGNTFAITTIASKISLVCAKFLKENEDVKYMIVVNDFKIEEGKLSIRARDPEFDCTLLYPFNGHKAAAGAQQPEEIINELLGDDAMCFKFKEELPEEITEDTIVLETCNEVLYTKLKEVQLGICI